MADSTMSSRRFEGPAVEARALGKQVAVPDGALTILDDISFRVNDGESLAILGASGSGKSTLLGLLAGLDQPTSGEAVLLGTPLNGLDEDARASLRGRGVGFVFQNFQLLPALTALENVMLPLELRGDAPAAIDSAARDVLRRVGLGERLGHYPGQLSGGEQQRVAIARAFVGSPRVLFADEPTGNLDAATGAAIIDLLFGLNDEHGTTLILVTHDPALAERSSRRIDLDAGRLVSAARTVAETDTRPPLSADA